MRQGTLGGVAATPLLHTQNCGMSRNRGVATPWSATGGGVASAPLSFLDVLNRSRFKSWSTSDSKSLANRACDLKRENSKTSTAIRTVLGLAIRIVRFEIAANQWRLESLRTANRDSGHLSLFTSFFEAPPPLNLAGGCSPLHRTRGGLSENHLSYSVFGDPNGCSPS